MNSNNLFKVIPNNFFNILTNNQQEIYVNSLFLLFDYLYKRNIYGEEKNKVIELLMNKVSKKKAMEIFQKLKKHGWIYEDKIKNYGEIVNFSYYAISILDTLNNLNKNAELEYNAFLSTIYLLLKNIDNNTLGDTLNKINFNLKMLTNILITLNIKIKKYTENLYKKQIENNFKTYIKDFLFDYQKQIVDKYYKNLKTRDNLSKYRPYIISKLNEISINDNIILKYASLLVKKNICQDIFVAKEYIYRQINFIISNLTNIEVIIKEIDYNNSYYINKSITKILGFVNNRDDNSRKIKKIINYLVDKGNATQINDNLFHFYSYSFLSQNSLYTMPKKYVQEEQIIKKKKNLDNFDKYKYYQKVIEKKHLNKNNILGYVKKFLNNNNQIYASELPLNNVEDYIKLIFIYLYSKNDYYSIIKTKEKFYKNGICFYDFIIRRTNLNE